MDAVPDMRLYRQGSAQTLLMNPDGTVKETVRDDDDFDDGGFSAAPLPDLNDDGVNEVLVGRRDGFGVRELVIHYPRPAFSTVGDLGDAPDPARGTGVFDYNTALSDNGPMHVSGFGLYLGETVSIDEGVDPTTAADTDDDDGLVNPDRDLIITGVPSFEFLSFE